MAGLSSSGAAGSGKLEARPGQSLVEGLFGPAESIHQRFPGLDGVLLQEQVFAAYKLEVADHIPYLKADGSPNVTRHRCNDRSYDETTEDLAVSIESRGCMIGVRGEAWAVKGSTYQMLTWGHLTEAVLLANSRSPDNPFVKKTVERGLHGVLCQQDGPDRSHRRDAKRGPRVRVSPRRAAIGETRKEGRVCA